MILIFRSFLRCLYLSFLLFLQRPLRSLNAIPALKNIVQTLLASIPDLVNVAALLGFVFLIFGILACQVSFTNIVHVIV